MRPHTGRQLAATTAAVVIASMSAHSIPAHAADASAQAASTSVEQRLQRLEAEQAAMQQQLQQRDARIQELERQLKVQQGAPSTPAAAPSPSQVAVGSAVPPPPVQAVASAAETGRSFEIYGFAETDVIYDFGRMNPDWDDAFRP
jgi:peptidoglycan hydrolase CwlO-like protein